MSRMKISNPPNRTHKMTLPPESFDQEKFWLLSTVSRTVKGAFSEPERETDEYEAVWCSLPVGIVFHMGRTHVVGVYSEDRWPGDHWTYRELLDYLDTVEEFPSRGTVEGWAKRVWRELKLDWFRPILEKLAAGEHVSYEEADRAHRAAHDGKSLRLYPFLAPVQLQEQWKTELDYDY